MKSSNNFSQEKGHGYFRKRNKVLVSMITVFGSLMLSSVAMADEVSSADTVAIPAAAITVATATEPKATEVFLKAYLIVLLFFNDDMTNSFLNVFYLCFSSKKNFCSSKSEKS